MLEPSIQARQHRPEAAGYPARMRECVKQLPQRGSMPLSNGKTDSDVAIQFQEAGIRQAVQWAALGVIKQSDSFDLGFVRDSRVAGRIRATVDPLGFFRPALTFVEEHR
jgi:hypothetical protein